MDFKITPDDAVYMAFGTAAQGLFQYFMRKRDKAFPTFAAAALVGGIGVAAGYRGLTNSPNMRNAAAFAFGFGISQIISYLFPLLTSGGATPETAPFGVA